METTEENSKTIKWNDFLDINEQDDFEFRLLDDGLGFHQKKAIEKKSPARKQTLSTRSSRASQVESSQIRPSRVRETRKIPTVPNLDVSPIRTVERTLDRTPGRTLGKSPMRAKSHSLTSPLSELPEVEMPAVQTGYPDRVSAPSNTTRKKSSNNQIEKPKTKKRLKLASVEVRLGAFVLDLFCLGIAAVLFALVGSFTVGVTIDQFAMKLMTPNYLPLVIGLFFGTFIFYFSLLDCDQSFGKQIMQIRVIDKESQKSARFGQCFTRAFLSILLVPVLFSLQDSMSETEVVRCN